MIAAAIISAIVGLIGAVVSGVQAHRQRQDMVDPDRQSEIGAASAAGNNALLQGTAQQTADFNNAQWTSSFLNQVDTYKRAGFNPLLLAQGGSSMNVTSAPSTPSNSVQTSTFDPSSIMNLASLTSNLPSSEDIQSAKLKNDLLRAQIESKRNQELRAAAKFGDEARLLKYSADNAEQAYTERVETYDARYQFLKNNLRNQDDLHDLNETKKQIDKLLLEQKQAEEQYFQDNALYLMEQNKAKKDLLKNQADESRNRADLLKKQLENYDEKYSMWKQQVEHQLDQTNPYAEINKMIEGFNMPDWLKSPAKLFLMYILGSRVGQDGKGRTEWQIGGL